MFSNWLMYTIVFSPQWFICLHRQHYCAVGYYIYIPRPSRVLWQGVIWHRNSAGVETMAWQLFYPIMMTLVEYEMILLVHWSDYKQEHGNIVKHTIIYYKFAM